MGAFDPLQIMIDSLKVGKRYRVLIFDIDKGGFGQESHDLIYVKSTFYGSTQVLTFDDYKTGKSFSIDVYHIENIEEIGDEEELNIHCKKIDIKVKETKPEWEDDVLKTLGLSEHPFIFIGIRDGDGFDIEPAMFIKKDEQELHFVKLRESSKLVTTSLVHPEDVIGEHPKYAFFRFTPPRRDYVHPDHLIKNCIKFDVPQIAHPELALGKVYVIKTDGKTRIGILYAIMDDYLKFIVNDIDGTAIRTLTIRAEDMKDAEIYKLEDNLWDE